MTNNQPELKGELEVIVNFMGNGLMKTRLNDVKDAELEVVLGEMFDRLMTAILQAKKGQFPDNSMPLFSEEQFKQI